MRNSKTIEEIYFEVKDCDLVITSDVVLASALNRQIRKATIGKLAYTPKELAAKFAPLHLEDRICSNSEIIISLRRELKKDIKFIHNTIQKILEIEQYTDLVENFLKHDEVAIYKKYSEMPSLSGALKAFDVNALSANVAVIESAFFNNLDKKVIPEKFEEISAFTDDDFTLSTFHTYSAQDQLLEEVVSLINKDNMSDFAVVLNSRDPILNLLKSKLYKKEIDIQAMEYLHENLNVRVFLDLISTAFQIDTLEISYIRPYLEAFGINIDYNFNHYLISKYVRNINRDKKLKQLYEFLKDIENKNYSQFYDFHKGVKLPIQLKETLSNLNLLKEKITPSNFSELLYYINNFDVEINSCKKGVLLVDSMSSVFIDKPVCVFINIDAGWTKEVKNAPYIEKDREELNNLKKFLILINQGDAKLYLASLITDNTKSIPCFYFNRIFKKEIKGFDDYVFNGLEHCFLNEKKAQLNEFKFNYDYEFEVFSQSSLNTFFECPKKYEFSRITPSEEQTYFLKGTLLHEFGEFFVNYKDFCHEKGEAFFTNLLLNEYMNMLPSENRELEKTMFCIAIRNIISFIDSFEIESEHSLKLPASQKKEGNTLSIKLDMPIYMGNTELFFEDKESKLKGFIDLVINSRLIVDYKSSKEKKKVKDISEKSLLQLLKDQADFQPLVYLLQFEKINPDKKLRFFYYFFIQNYKDVINEEIVEESNIVEINYYPFSFNEFLCTFEAIDILISFKKKRKDVLQIGSENIISILKKYPIDNPFEFKKEIDAYKKIESELLAIKDTQANRNAVEDFFKEIFKLRTGQSKDYKIALYFKEDLQVFKKFVNEQFRRVMHFKKSGFPLTPKSKEICDKCEYIDMCLVKDHE